MKIRKKSREARPTVNGEISPANPLTERGDGAATSGAGVARKIAHLTPGERVARGKAARNEAPGPAMAVGSRPSTDPTLLGCSRSRRQAGFLSWFPSVTGGCWCRRSPSTGAPR